MSVRTLEPVIHPGLRCLSEVKEAMAIQIRQLLNQVSANSAKRALSPFIRIELPIAEINILFWLYNQRAETRIYWSGRDGSFEFGAIGIADRLKGEGKTDHKELFDYVNSRLSSKYPRLRYYGGLCFDPLRMSGEWGPFGTYQFVIPKFEILRTNGQAIFAFNIAADRVNREDAENAIIQLNQLDFSSEISYRKPPKVLKRLDVPTKEQWNIQFPDILHGIHGKRYDKVVLARESVFGFDVDIRTCALMKHLKDKTPNCFHFCFQPERDTAFLGASPERLYKRSQNQLLSEAIAGTRPRGEDSYHDKQLESQLSHSSKDAYEHKLVVDMVQEQMRRFCRHVETDETALKKLNGSQHLQTSLEGELKSGIRDQEILKALHPTPAVAGTPTETAMDVIRKNESFARGWYAGPIGYVGYDTSEFAVAIRSGLVHSNQLSLYAGAGIVAGSTSDAEWDEIENKIGNFIGVFDK
ncbi:MAG: isochorismate synthase [Candidatus Omnitrophica bacterium]|nr:isochorismate synthase [Candidatus Omnitrophota bacterium]